MTECPNCGIIHRTVNKLARCRWPRAGVCGEGPWASFARCRTLTIELYDTKEAASRAKRMIDGSHCGGGCIGPSGHWVTRIKGAGPGRRPTNTAHRPIDPRSGSIQSLSN